MVMVRDTKWIRRVERVTYDRYITAFAMPCTKHINQRIVKFASLVYYLSLTFRPYHISSNIVSRSVVCIGLYKVATSSPNKHPSSAGACPNERRSVSLYLSLCQGTRNKNLYLAAIQYRTHTRHHCYMHRMFLSFLHILTTAAFNLLPIRPKK